MPRKKKRNTRLFREDESYTPEASHLDARIEEVVRQFLAEMPDVDLNDVHCVVGRAGRTIIDRAILARRRKERGL